MTPTSMRNVKLHMKKLYSHLFSSYATDAIKWAIGASLINGRTATRAEVATIRQRFVENVK
jgi:hypothetical protein